MGLRWLCYKVSRLFRRPQEETAEKQTSKANARSDDVRFLEQFDANSFAVKTKYKVFSKYPPVMKETRGAFGFC